MSPRQRYKVATVTGYKIGANGQRSGRVPATDYAILDTAWCHRQVATFSSEHRPERVARRMAWELAGILNAGGELEWYDTTTARWRPQPRPGWHRREYPTWPYL